jgi:hypothetical protein
MDSSGSNFKQITKAKPDSDPVCSSDGKWALFIDQANERKVARVPMDGGTPQWVSDLPASGSFDVSPDGKIVAFPSLQHSGEHKEMLAVVETEGGRAKLMAFERPRFGLLHFYHDGKGVVYPTRENGVDNLWLQLLNGSKVSRLQNSHPNGFMTSTGHSMENSSP